MDLHLTPEQQQLRDASRRILSERLAALVERLPAPVEHDLLQAVRDGQELGWLGLGLPEASGGAGGLGDLALVHEELGRGLAPSLLTTLGLAGRVLLHCEPGPVRDELLEQLCTGSVLLAPALGDGVTAVQQEDGHLHLEGRQRHVVDAAAASSLLLAARDADTGHRYLARLNLDLPGVAFEDQPSLTDVRQCSVTLTAVDLPPDAVLMTDAAAALRDVRCEATVLAAARAVGGGRAVLDRTVEHVRTRHQFDRPIGTFQAVQHQLADVATALDAAGLAVARATWAVESPAGADELATAAGIAGLAASEAFTRATLVAHQLHGGMGFVLDSPLHLWSARAVADGTGPTSRRQLIDELGAALGLTDHALRLPANHRVAP